MTCQRLPLSVGCRDSFFRVAISANDDGGDVASEGQNSFYRKRHGDQYELLSAQPAPKATPPAGEFHFHGPASQYNRSSTKLVLIAINNPTSINVHLSSATTQRKLSLISLRLMLADIPRRGYGTDLSPVFHVIASFQRSVALASYEFAKNKRKSTK